MKKHDRARITSILRYLQDECAEAWASKNEDLFDWYSAGMEAYCCILEGKPITYTPRVKPL